MAITLLFVLSGIAWQAIAVAYVKNDPPSVGGYIHTYAYDMHYVSQGTGDIAVVFIAGSGTPSAYTDFYRLRENLSNKVQTISFDHAGSGWSSTTDVPRTVENLEKEIKELLECVASEKRVILVCHSVGALEGIYFAQNNPDTVAGIIFLDSGSPEFYRTDSEFTAELLNRGIAVARIIGLNRFLCSLEIPISVYGENERLKSLPSDIADIDKAMFNKYAGNKETLKSIKEMNENGEKVADGLRLGDLPLLVLSSDSGEEWGAVQCALAEWSENSRQLTLVNSSHYLHWSNADEVEVYIRDFIESINQ